jgi:hypothetical protein
MRRARTFPCCARAVVEQSTPVWTPRVVASSAQGARSVSLGDMNQCVTATVAPSSRTALQIAPHAEWCAQDVWCAAVHDNTLCVCVCLLPMQGWRRGHCRRWLL